MSEIEDTDAHESEHVDAPRRHGSLTFVGSGSADITLVPYAGERAIAQADLVVVDSPDVAESLASSGIRTHAQVVCVDSDEPTQLIREVDAGKRVVRLSAGDFYDSHFREVTLPAVLGEHRVRTHLIPGVSRWVSALTYGAVAPTASFATLDASRGVGGEDWPQAGTLVVWTNPERLVEVAEQGAQRFGASSPVLVLTNLGTSSQTTQLAKWRELANGKVDVDSECYLVVGPGIVEAERQRLDWFASKPLFDWRIVIPRTKDDLGELTGHLARFGATSEIVATISIEPPRTEQAMEKAVRGIVDGRYLWIVFTSPHSIGAIMERLAEYGLDSRALSGISLAAVGRGTAEALRKYGLRADLTPVGDNTVAGLALEFPAFDDLIDPIERVLVPTADVSVQPLIDGLVPLGWDVEEVTAYRTVRAAPPPADTREAIKTGLFDAVVFTSSTAVRNMIGIAGKPHAAMAVAAIGPATAQACELHGLKVDVVAESPTYESLAEGLARFAENRLADQIARGVPVKKPSERRRRRRKVAAAPDA
ncbi:uroporphyrinogen-III synthase [Tessaracoccus sp. OS52]|uniref:uroporphyrinogen-III synthase n=1 Tax=Tessaracoccus sp. OS52 TaxID=2886691 RepID=UPI001D11BE8A|nr:uroporphyrinogen-III synthase [Tessaracoccus sp. OS52]